VETARHRAHVHQSLLLPYELCTSSHRLTWCLICGDPSSPFWATQWHAERTQFEWDLNEDLVHDAQSIAAHSYVAQRWMMNARQSAHRFPTEAIAEQTLIYNYQPTYTGNDPSASFPDRQVYEFDFTF
jgi:hypothetical protein